MGYRRRRRKTITLKFEGKCADPNCGAILPVGTTARWYGRGRVYGLTCHEDSRQEVPMVVAMPEYAADEEGAQLENRPSDDPNEAIRFEVEVPGLGVKMKTGKGAIPQTKLFD